MTSSFNTPHELERHEGEHSMPLGLAIFGESRRRKRSVLFALICLGLAPVAFTTAALPSMIGPGVAMGLLCLLGVTAGLKESRPRRRRNVAIGIELRAVVQRATVAAERLHLREAPRLPLVMAAILDDALVTRVLSRARIAHEKVREKLNTLAARSEPGDQTYRTQEGIKLSADELGEVFDAATKAAHAEQPVLPLGILLAASEVRSPLRETLRAVGIQRHRLRQAIAAETVAHCPQWSLADEQTQEDLYAVVVHNDDVTSGLFVAETLVDVFAFDVEGASTLMRVVHESKQATVRHASKTRAEALARETRRRAAFAGFPLRVTVALVSPEAHDQPSPPP